MINYANSPKQVLIKWILWDLKRRLLILFFNLLHFFGKAGRAGTTVEFPGF